MSPLRSMRSLSLMSPSAHLFMSLNVPLRSPQDQPNSAKADVIPNS